jgi:hypothetical protein
MAQLGALVAESLMHSSFLLAPTGRAHVRASLVGPLLRTGTDLYAKLLDIFSKGGEDRIARLHGQFRHSLELDQKALVAATMAGLDVSAQQEQLADLIGDFPPRSVTKVARALRDQGEHELEAVYHWESASVHLGGNYLAIRGATVLTPIGVVDVALAPISPFRLGQLTWAAYGVHLRLISKIANEMSWSMGEILGMNAECREVVRTTAKRTPSPVDGPHPPYGEMGFELWPGE